MKLIVVDRSGLIGTEFVNKLRKEWRQVEAERTLVLNGDVRLRGTGFGSWLGPPSRQISNASLHTTRGKGRLGHLIAGTTMLALAFLITSTLIANTLMAQTAVTSPTAQETITPLMSKDLAGFPDKEVLMYTVDFPAGFSSPIHRHNAQVSVYVLEGSVVMQVRGGKEVTLGPGQSFYEDPNDIHVVSRNASTTKAAKFLVFLIHKKAAPLVIPAK